MNLLQNFAHDTLCAPTCNTQSGEGRLSCDAWHHYYHYQASAQYLWYAETLRTLGRDKEALAAYERAVFQDHFNEEALAGKKETPRAAGQAPRYDKHPAFDLEFKSLIGELPDDATQPHDAGVTAMVAGDLEEALRQLDKAIALQPQHSNSWFARGKCHFLAQRFEEAAADFANAIRLSHLHHDGYHRTASAEHLARGREFLKRGETELAINEFTKALDLHRGNKEALLARAQAYRAKGSEKLALEDEERLKAFS